MDIEIGFPLIVTDHEGLEEHGIKEKHKGFAANYIEIPETGEKIVGFQPDGERRVVLFSASRVKVDKRRLKKLRGE